MRSASRSKGGRAPRNERHSTTQGGVRHPRFPPYSQEASLAWLPKLPEVEPGSSASAGCSRIRRSEDWQEYPARDQHETPDQSSARLNLRRKKSAAPERCS